MHPFLIYLAPIDGFGGGEKVPPAPAWLREGLSSQGDSGLIPLPSTDSGPPSGAYALPDPHLMGSHTDEGYAPAAFPGAEAAQEDWANYEAHDEHYGYGGQGHPAPAAGDEYQEYYDGDPSAAAHEVQPFSEEAHPGADFHEEQTALSFAAAQQDDQGYPPQEYPEGQYPQQTYGPEAYESDFDAGEDEYAPQHGPVADPYAKDPAPADPYADAGPGDPYDGEPASGFPQPAEPGAYADDAPGGFAPQGYPPAPQDPADPMAYGGQDQYETNPAFRGGAHDPSGAGSPPITDSQDPYAGHYDDSIPTNPPSSAAPGFSGFPSSDSHRYVDDPEPSTEFSEAAQQFANNYAAPSADFGFGNPEGKYDEPDSGWRPSAPPPPLPDSGPIGDSPYGEGPIPPPAPGGAEEIGPSYPASRSDDPFAPKNSNLRRGGSYHEDELKLPKELNRPPSTADKTEGREIDAVAMPEAASDPGYQQMSISQLKSGAKPSAPEPEPEAEDEDWQAPMVVPAMAGASPRDPGNGGYSSPPSDSDHRRAPIDSDGVPRHIPEPQAVPEEESRPARRITGAAWMVFVLLMFLWFALLEQPNVGGTLLAPALVLGAFLLTGARWASVLGLVMGIAYGAGIAWAGFDLAFGSALNDYEAFKLLNPLVHYGLIGLGATVFLASFIMLAGRPGVGRAAIGGGLLVLPSVVLLALLVATAFTPQEGLGAPRDGFVPREYGSTVEGFTFQKPAGWGNYGWTSLSANEPMVAHLEREPNYHFLSEDGNMMVLFYLDAVSTGATVAQLFGAQTLTEAETELLAGLDPVQGATSTFEYDGLTFQEAQYTGTPPGAQQPLAVTIDKARIGSRVLIIALLRHANGPATAADAEEALNSFYEQLEISSK